MRLCVLQSAAISDPQRGGEKIDPDQDQTPAFDFRCSTAEMHTNNSFVNVFSVFITVQPVNFSMRRIDPDQDQPPASDFRCFTTEVHTDTFINGLASSL